MKIVQSNLKIPEEGIIYDQDDDDGRLSCQSSPE